MRSNIGENFTVARFPRDQWMDYRCRLGPLGNSYIASGRRDPWGTVGSSYSLGRHDFFFLGASVTSFHTHASLLFFCFCLISFLQTLVRDVHIYYSLNEWYCFFSRQRNYKCTMCMLSKKGEILKHL